MNRLDPLNHAVTCLHEAAHVVLFHHMGLYVFGASVVGAGDKFRRTVGSTQYVAYEGNDPELVERMSIGICAGYVCETLAYGVERFDGEDVNQLCNRDGGYEIGYAAHLCEFCIGGDAFEEVILKTKNLLLTPGISKAVNALADLLHAYGEIDHSQIAAVMDRHEAELRFSVCLSAESTLRNRLDNYSLIADSQFEHEARHLVHRTEGI